MLGKYLGDFGNGRVLHCSGCTNPTNPNVKGREQCYSKNLCEQFDRVRCMRTCPIVAGTANGVLV